MASRKARGPRARYRCCAGAGGERYFGEKTRNLPRSSNVQRVTQVNTQVVSQQLLRQGGGALHCRLAMKDDDNQELNPMEELCCAFVEGELNEQETHLLVRFLLENKGLRHELRRHLQIHDGLTLVAMLGWDV